MYQLTVPFWLRDDPTMPDQVRRPRIPDAWKFEQVSSLLDTGPHARAAKRLTVINVREPDRVVEGWLANVSHVERAHQLHPDVAAIRERPRFTKAASREYWSATREAAKTHIAAEETKEQTRRIARAVLPFLGTLTVYQIARMLGLAEADVVLGISAGTTLIEDAWSGSSGDDLEGRTADTVDPGGTWVTTHGANGMEISTTGPRVENTGASASTHEICWNSAMSAIGDQFSETQRAHLHNSFVGVRLDGAGHAGYIARPNTGSIYRAHGTTNHSLLNNDVTVVGDQAMRLEIIDDTLDVYLDSTGAWVTSGAASHTTATDSTHATGIPGFEVNIASARYIYRWRGGSISSGSLIQSHMGGIQGRSALVGGIRG